MKLRIFVAMLFFGSTIARTETPHTESKIKKAYNRTKKHIISAKEWIYKNKLVKYGIGIITVMATLRGLYVLNELREKYLINNLLVKDFDLYHAPKQKISLPSYDQIPLTDNEKEQFDLLSQKYLNSDGQDEEHAFLEFYIYFFKIVCSKNKEKEPKVIAYLLEENRCVESNFNTYLDRLKISTEMKNNIRMNFINSISEDQFLKELQDAKISRRISINLLSMFQQHGIYKKIIEELTGKTFKHSAL